MNNFVKVFCPVERVITKFKKLNGDYLCLNCHYKCGENRLKELKGMEI